MAMAARRNRGSLLTWMAVAFVVTVLVTRVYLQLSGFPSIGSGKIHLAHAVWGGLLLIIAAILPLMLAPSRVLTLCAVLGGIGAGLFMDEVGKFLTSDNDYFFAPAAPLIYGTGVLLVLLAVRAREHRPTTTTARWYAALDLLGEAADDHMSKREEAAAVTLLDAVTEDETRPDLTQAAGVLRDEVEQWELPEYRPSRLRAAGRALDRWDRRVIPTWVYGVLSILGSVAFFVFIAMAGIAALLLAVDSGLRSDLSLLIDSEVEVATPVAVVTMWVCVAACVISLVMLLAALVVRLTGRPTQAATWAIRGCVLTLIVVNLAASYIDISILAVIMVFQLLAIAILLRYRVRAAT